MPIRTIFPPALCALLASACLLPSYAVAITYTPFASQPIQNLSRTWYVQPGVGEDGAYAASVGLTQAWPHRGWMLAGGHIQGHWDAFASGWSGEPAGASRRAIAVLGAGPSLRWRGARGQSAWFVELGTAVSYASHRWQHETRTLSTRLNFASHAGVGWNWGPNQLHEISWNWGPNQLHEISVRLQHTSNAGLKRPNPGADFVLLRYARRF